MITAIKSNHGIVEAQHFVRALYSTSETLLPQAIDGQANPVLEPVTADKDDDNDTSHATISPHFQLVLDNAVNMTLTEQLSTEAVVFSILMNNGKQKEKPLALLSPTAGAKKEEPSRRAIVGPVDAQVMPRFGGAPTFARLPRLDQVTFCDVAILGQPYDSGCTYRPGARFGPSAVRQASRILRPYHTTLKVNAFHDQQCVDAGDVCCNPFNVTETMTTVVDHVSELLQLPSRPRIVAVGGDHSISYPLLKAHCEAYVVPFDHHFVTVAYSSIQQLDTWDAYFGETHTHGTPFLRAAEEHLFRPDASMHVGIRGPVYSSDDYARDATLGFSMLNMDAIEDMGVAGVVKQIRDRVGQHPIYLSIDIDVLDPAFAPGTGTPEAGGLSTRELFGMLRGLRGLNVVGADVMEVAPAYDHAEITALAAASIVFELISLMATSSAKILSATCV
ncbi:hypothetical protein DYB35_005502 [Aphanomyces astaci]|uniref:Agmatinase n=2 Tax=Aphanomyces astaci TaxID=112090 RepID=A0A418DHH5_APHAT|nr:hypothetical protein DYB35_005502 [Aphanomyces astaci]